jgi:aminopeptidase N
LQDSTYTPIYRLPLQLSVWQNKKRTNYPITVTEAQQTFEFALPTAPELVLFDGAQQLLGQVDHAKTDAELVYQYYNSGQYVPKYEALRGLSKKVNEAPVVDVFKAALQDPFAQTRSDALIALEKYSGGDAAIVTIIQNLAQRDKKSSVRADAVNTLATLENADNSAVYTQALKDSSYAVVAAGIQALTSTKKAGQVGILKAYENLNSGEVMAALAGYYAFFGGPEQYDWYLKTLDRVRGEQLFFFLQNFGGYLVNVPVEAQKPAIDRLEKIARTHETYYVKLGAYQALTLAGADRPEIKALKDDIKAKEKDPKLLEIYKNINY